MDFFAHPIVAVVLLLGLLILVHEAGHFFVGKLCGIPVEIFSIGFGPIIFNVKRGETEYRLSVIPFGGFVKFYGSTRRDDAPPHLRGREFWRAPLWKRALTILAGPLANFLLAIVAYTGMVMVGIPQPPAVVGEIMKDSPAEKAGLRFGDRITAINGSEVETWRDLQSIVMESPSASLDFDILRRDEALKITVTPDNIYDGEMIGKKYRGQIGITPGQVNSVVSVLRQDSLAAKAGILTGDRITAMSWDEKTRDVKFWRQFLTDLAEARDDGANEVTLTLSEPVTLKVAETSRKTKTVTLALPRPFPETPEMLASAMGLQHSQLTLAADDVENMAPLKAGDVLVRFGSHDVADVFDLRKAILAEQQPVVPMTFMREGESMTAPVPLKPVDVQKAEGRVTMYTFTGVFLGQIEQPEPVLEQRKNPLAALWYGVKQTGVQVGMISVAIAGLFTGDMPLEALGGPISIAKVASDSVKLGWMSFLSALGLVSVNLGLLNLFPIPVLDGGQLVLLGAEAVKRRPLGDLAIENFQKIGFIMVLALVVLATYNDLSRFWASMLRGVSGIIP